MSKRKAGIPSGFKLDIEKPEPHSKPVRLGDYLDEEVTPQNKQPPAPSKPDPVAQAESPLPNSNIDLFGDESPKAAKPLSTTVNKRTRLNVSNDSRKKLSAIVDRMARYGPEPDVRASEVVEALIIALYDVRENLDLNNVRRRGKYGSPSHKNFPISLAESITKAMSKSSLND